MPVPQAQDQAHHWSVAVGRLGCQRVPRTYKKSILYFAEPIFDTITPPHLVAANIGVDMDKLDSFLHMALTSQCRAVRVVLEKRV